MKFLITILLSGCIYSYGQGIFNPSPVKTIKREGEVWSMAFQPDDKALLIGTSDKKCILYSLEDNKEVFSVPGLTMGARACSYTQDGRYFLVAFDKIVKIFYPNGEFVNLKGGPATQIWSFSVNQVTNKIAYGSYDKNIRITDFTTGSVTTLSGHLQNALTVKYSPDNKLLATGSLDKTIKIWDAETLTLKADLTGHGGNIYDLAFSPDSKMLYSASNDNTIRIWNLENFKTEKVLNANTKAILCLSVSPDGKYLICGTFDGALILWDIARTENIYTFHNHTGQINVVSFSNNGKFIASGSADKSIYLYELRPEIFIEKYYSTDFKTELDTSGLFIPKAKDETKEAYKLRIVKADSLKSELIQKYFSKYKADICGKSTSK